MRNIFFSPPLEAEQCMYLRVFAAKMVKTATKEKEREFLIECIQLYRDLPALWKVKSKEYHDREQKNTAYEILLEKYKEMFPEATKDDVKKKI